MLSVKTRKVKNRAATALRMAAQSLHHSQSYLGQLYRRMPAKQGAPTAITATAHKLARIIYHMVTSGQEYHETIRAQNEPDHRQRLEARLRKQAPELGLQPCLRREVIPPTMSKTSIRLMLGSEIAPSRFPRYSAGRQLNRTVQY